MTLEISESPLGINVPATELTQEVVIWGKNVDPRSKGTDNESYFTVRNSEVPGIRFRIGDCVIPYTMETLKPMDTFAGRMLTVSEDDHGPQVVIVEHLISACALLGLNNIEIELNSSCFAPMLSGRLSDFAPSCPLLDKVRNITNKIGFGRPTSAIPVCGPGIFGFVKDLRPFCKPSGETSDVVRITREVTHSIMDPKKKYGGIQRTMTISPHNIGEINVMTADQPDIRNCPESNPFSIYEGQDLSPYVAARPIMRIPHRFQEIIIYLLNLTGSYALSHENYFKARKGITRDQVAARMWQIYQTNKNEHLAHTAIADYPAELWAFLQGRHFKGKITIHNGTHVFRHDANRRLFVPDNFSTTASQ